MHTSDPFDPLDSSSSLSAAGDAPCPKCGWRQSPMNATCAACGLIFARFHAARVRPVPSTPAASSVSSATTASSSSFEEERAANIVGSATSSSSSVIATLFGLHAAPGLALMVVGFGLAWFGGSFIVGGQPGLSALGAELARAMAGHGFSDGAAGVVSGAVAVFAVFAALVTVVLAGVMSSSTIVVDDHMRTGEDRGFIEVLRDGMASALPVAGVFVLVAAGAMLPMVLGFAVSATTSSKAVAVVAVVASIVGAATIMVRSSLAVPAVVLGDRGIVDAMRDSWVLTRGRGFATLGTLLLGGAVAMVIGGIAAVFSWIPVLGVVLTVVANAIGNGITSGVAAGMWRARVDA